MSAASLCSGVAPHKLHRVQICNPLPAYTCVRLPPLSQGQRTKHLPCFCSTTAVLCIAVEKACDSVYVICGEPTFEALLLFTCTCQYRIPAPSVCLEQLTVLLSKPSCLLGLGYGLLPLESLKFDAVLPESNFPI